MKSLLSGTSSTPPPVVLSSSGIVLIYGMNAVAVEAAQLLSDVLDVTVLLMPDAEQPANVSLPFPVVRGKVRAAVGYLGAFEVTIDRYVAQDHGRVRDGALSRCEIFIDLSGGAVLFPAFELRDGYLRADPLHRDGWLNAVSRARELIGTFEKPRYIDFSAGKCAHSRSRITGCTRCLDSCPTGAITSAGDQVQINAFVCAGCGQCAAVCPTGAAVYTLPRTDDLTRAMRSGIEEGRARHTEPISVLFYDESHGAPLIDWLEEHRQMPDSIVPLAVNEVTQVGLEVAVSVFVYGASSARFLVRGRARHDIAALRTMIDLANHLLQGLGFGHDRVALLETDDPDELAAALRALPDTTPIAHPGAFVAMGMNQVSGRHRLLQELHRLAPAPVDIIPLPKGASFGSVDVDVAGCTLCLSCVTACPTMALKDNGDLPMLRFTEDACIQCGLCQATCPEKVITLRPQMDFRLTTNSPRVLKTEEPQCCLRCGKPFGVKSTIDRIVAKLADQHWMFTGSVQRIDLIRMCDTCRVAAVSEMDFDPHAPPRPSLRTTDDYLRERDLPSKKPI